MLAVLNEHIVFDVKKTQLYYLKGNLCP